MNSLGINGEAGGAYPCRSERVAKCYEILVSRVVYRFIFRLLTLGNDLLDIIFIYPQA